MFAERVRPLIASSNPKRSASAYKLHASRCIRRYYNLHIFSTATTEQDATVHVYKLLYQSALVIWSLNECRANLFLSCA